MIFYFKVILKFCTIFCYEEENFEGNLAGAFVNLLREQIYPVYNYLKRYPQQNCDVSEYIDLDNYFISYPQQNFGIPEYIAFNLDDFKSQSDNFISDFSKFFKSSIECGSQHGHSGIEEKKEWFKK